MVFLNNLIQEKKIKFDLIFFINLFFCTFPLSYILGNLLINLNILILCILGIVYLNKSVFSFRPNFFFKLIILFFFVVLFSTAINIVSFDQKDSLYFLKTNYDNTIKAIALFRYLILLIVIYLLSSYNKINFKYFIYVATFFSVTLSLDVIFQYFFGYDIFGFESASSRRNAGFFGYELIAGGFIERFSFLSIFLIFYITNEKKWKNFFITSGIIYILGLGILFSGERMPFILFLLGLILIFIFFERLRRLTIFSFVALLITIILLLSTNNPMKNSYAIFYQSSKDILIKISSNFIEHNKDDNINVDLKKNTEEGAIVEWDKARLQSTNYHEALFLTAFDTWKINKIFGNGLKSFKRDCWKIIQSRYKYQRDKSDVERYVKSPRSCSNHPHNYYLEILTEIGLAGFLFIILFFMTLLIFSFTFFIKNKNKILDQNNLILMAALVSLIIELFPLRSSGSFFSTQNASYIIYMTSIIMSLKESYITS